MRRFPTRRCSPRGSGASSRAVYCSIRALIFRKGFRRRAYMRIALRGLRRTRLGVAGVARRVTNAAAFAVRDAARVGSASAPGGRHDTGCRRESNAGSRCRRLQGWRRYDHMDVGGRATQGVRKGERSFSAFAGRK
jgi:hypothetical protein